MVRRVFRAARFHGLLYEVRRDASGRTILILDGPMSLFDSVQRYGLKLALFLPSVLSFSSFEVRADLLWGKERTPSVLVITRADGLVSTSPDPPSLAPELEVFMAAFTRLGSEWDVKPCDEVIALPGEAACVPDLVFDHRVTGERVYLEVFGFWSRAAVWQRIELIRGGFPGRILLAVGKHLRVSEEALGEEDAGEIYVFKQTLSPRAVLSRLEQRYADPH